MRINPKSLFFRALRTTAILDRLDHIMRVLVVDLAADRLGGAKHLQDGALEGFGQAARAHDAGDLKEVIEADRTVMDNCGKQIQT